MQQLQKIISDVVSGGLTNMLQDKLHIVTAQQEPPKLNLTIWTESSNQVSSARLLTTHQYTQQPRAKNEHACPSNLSVWESNILKFSNMSR